MEYDKIDSLSFIYSVEKINKKLEEKIEKNSDKLKNKQLPKKNFATKMRETYSKAEMLKTKWKKDMQNVYNTPFYVKYLDRVKSGLYERYGSEAEVLENKMRGDPVYILNNECKTYIQEIVHGINNIYTELLNTSKKLENAMSVNDAINIAKEFSKNVLSKNLLGNSYNPDKDSWEGRIYKSTRLKIANVITRKGERKIYGYTTENMVLKKFPTPNHLIVTLFVENPEEKPDTQPVNEIFQDVNSFDILANAEKNDTFAVGKMIEAALNKTANDKIFNEIKFMRQNNIKNIKNAKQKDDDIKIIDSIWDGMSKSCKELLTKKYYIIECINTYMDMVFRINRLAKNSIKSMLDVENKYRDKKYDRHLKVSHKGEVDKEKNDEKKERMREISDTAKKLNKM